MLSYLLVGDLLQFEGPDHLIHDLLGVSAGGAVHVEGAAAHAHAWITFLGGAEVSGGWEGGCVGAGVRLSDLLSGSFDGRLLRMMVRDSLGGKLTWRHAFGSIDGLMMMDHCLLLCCRVARALLLIIAWIRRQAVGVISRRAIQCAV